MNVVSVVVLCQEMVCVSLMEKQGQTRSSKLLCIFGGRHVVIWRSSALHGNEKSSKQLYILSNATIWGGGNYPAVCVLYSNNDQQNQANKPARSFIHFGLLFLLQNCLIIHSSFLDYFQKSKRKQTLPNP